MYPLYDTLHYTHTTPHTALHVHTQMIGLAKGALEAITPYIHEREAFGQKIADFQAMQHWRAELATDIEAASLLVYNTARMHEQGLPYVKEAAMAKYFSSEVGFMCSP